ncbi:form wall Protein 1 [Cyberlindnera fabianii]|uniref:Form wall Protein 1 n=1 Tax=Cyberlindnera fabianii TaxID=36022 RepID=A0A1V2L8J1_CYBFA|nr:form wall Protein 1 [Cyberlindnera fabianii]
MFSKVVLAAAAASVASAAYSNATTVVDFSNSTTVVTITSCEENKCTEVPVTTGLTVVTVTSSGVVTEYTTYCPLTSEDVTSTATEQLTSTVAHNATTAEISTFEAGAVKAVPAVAALAAGVALLF